MTTDELRAKFEAHFSQPPYEWTFARYIESQAWPGSYTRYNVQCAWESYQAAHASRDVEVEALRKDAERWRHARKLLLIVDIEKLQHDFMAYGDRVYDKEGCVYVDEAIDAAMREGE